MHIETYLRFNIEVGPNDSYYYGYQNKSLRSALYIRPDCIKGPYEITGQHRMCSAQRVKQAIEGYYRNLDQHGVFVRFETEKELQALKDLLIKKGFKERLQKEVKYDYYIFISKTQNAFIPFTNPSTSIDFNDGMGLIEYWDKIDSIENAVQMSSVKCESEEYLGFTISKYYSRNYFFAFIKKQSSLFIHRDSNIGSASKMKNGEFMNEFDTLDEIRAAIRKYYDNIESFMVEFDNQDQFNELKHAAGLVGIKFSGQIHENLNYLYVSKSRNICCIATQDNHKTLQFNTAMQFFNRLPKVKSQTRINKESNLYISEEAMTEVRNWDAKAEGKTFRNKTVKFVVDTAILGGAAWYLWSVFY